MKQDSYRKKRCTDLIYTDFIFTDFEPERPTPMTLDDVAAPIDATETPWWTNNDNSNFYEVVCKNNSNNHVIVIIITITTMIINENDKISLSLLL